MSRPAIGALVGWCFAFVVVHGYWIGSEAAEPGQQYADPLVPSAFIALLFGVPPGMIVAALIGRGRP